MTASNSGRYTAKQEIPNIIQEVGNCIVLKIIVTVYNPSSTHYLVE